MQDNRKEWQEINIMQNQESNGYKMFKYALHCDELLVYSECVCCWFLELLVDRVSERERDRDRDREQE